MKTLTRKFFLGVDGGATKSTAILVDENGNVMGKRKGGPLNWRTLGEKSARENIKKLMSPLMKKAKGKNIYAVFGLAGLDTRKDEVIYKKITKALMPKRSVYLVVGDALIALEAKCPGARNRVLVISGTGSTVVGQSEGREVRSAAWDFILADEGSGYMVGLKALKAAVRFFDGRGEKTLLHELVLQKKGMNTMEDFIPEVYEIFYDKKQSFKQYIASFSPLVDTAILQSDHAALKIREETVQELLDALRAVVLRLQVANEKFCIGLVGSVWKMRGMEAMFKKEVQKEFSQAYFSDRKESGVWGAVSLARKLV